MRTHETKIFAGSRIRELRRSIKETQKSLAERLGLSASYLNQIENDQRPIPMPLMLKICKMFDVSPAYFGDSDEIRQIQSLREILGDPLFNGAPLGPADLQAAVRAAPALAERLVTLYRAYRAAADDGDGGAVTEERRLGTASPPASMAVSPYHAVADWVQRERNYFGAIDRAAERLYESENLFEDILPVTLARYLRDRHGIRVVTESSLDDRALLWRFDRRGHRLLIADGVPAETMTFCMAQLAGRLDYGRLLDQEAARSGLVSPDAREVARAGLSNYFAGALLLPYSRFRRTAREKLYDIDQLQRSFGVSFEQVCHRLSTLQRPGEEGIPFYFIKTDIAGNILKGYSANRFSLPRFGGLCSLWNVFRSFSAPGQLHVQLSQTTDHAVFINVARTVGHAGTSYFDMPRRVAVVLGCSVSHASELVYSAGLDLADRRMIVPIGPGCRACIRTDCRHRAVPAAGFQIDAGGVERGVLPYHMVAAEGQAK